MKRRFWTTDEEVNNLYESGCIGWDETEAVFQEIENRKKNVDTITHGDGDGTIAAAIACHFIASGIITATQPFLLHKLPDLEHSTVILDMAVDNRNPEATLNWVRRNKDNIVLWVDHHQGGEGLAEILGDRFIYDSEAPSCPELMSRDGFDVPNEWIATANACDRPADYQSTPLSKRYNAAFKVALVALQAGDRSAVSEVQHAFITELLSGNEHPLVSKLVMAYSDLLDATNKAAEEYRKIVYNVVLTQVETQASADITTLLFAGYKLAPVAVIQTKSVDDGSEITIVATNIDKRELDLVEAFQLGSGNPSRVTLVGGSHKEQLVKVRETLG